MSVFNLKTNVSELSSANQGQSRMEYQQIAPSRDATGSSFPNGTMHFRFQNAGQKWWNPSRTYMRIRCSLTKADGTTQAGLADEVAPNMGLCANLFQSGEFRINDKVVSRIGELLPQVDALEHRLSQSRGWLNSAGKSTNMWDPDFAERQAVVASDAKQYGAIEDIRTSQLNLGTPVPTTVTVAVAAATGILTFAGAGVVNTNLNFVIGDKIEIDHLVGDSGTVTYEVTDLPTINGPTMTVSPSPGTDIGASLDGFARIRKSNKARSKKDLELIWQPPLSIFKIDHALPSGSYELVLNPQNQSAYKKYAIESLLGAGDKVAATDYDFSITDIYLYVNTVEASRVDNITYLLDLEQTRCQAQSVSTASFQQKAFDVSPSTYALTVAYQDSRAGNNSQASASKFKSYNAALSSVEELKLNRMFVNYAGVNKPSPDADPTFDATKDHTTQRYIDTQMYSGCYFSEGGCETIEEFHDRGSYYYLPFPRDATDRSTRVNVHSSHTGADVDNMRVLLFDHSKQTGRVQIQDGRVVSVELEDA